MKSYRRVLAFARPFTKPLLAAGLLTGLLTLIGMAPPLLLRRLINDVAREGNWGIFELIVGLMLAIPLLRAVVNVCNSLVLRRINLGIIAKTRKRMFSHLMELSLDFYGRTPPGSILQRIMNDVFTISSTLTGNIVMLLTDALAVCFSVVVMVRISLPLSALTFALLPLYYLNYRFFSKRIQANTAMLRSHMDHISSSLQERLSAHELIQAYGQEQAQAVQFSSQAKQIMDQSIRGAAYSISYNQLTAFTNKIGNTCIYCAGCYLFLVNKLDYGDVVAFCAYATQLLGPVVRFARVSTHVAQAGVSADRIQQLLDEKPAVVDRADVTRQAELSGQLTIEGVSFFVGDDRELDNIQITIPAKAHVALAGDSSSGASTLAKLLRRFYDPSEGSIRIDGVDIRDLPLRDYRKRVAMILPQSAIFDGSIRENLLYGKPDAEESQVHRICQEIGLHEFVCSLSNGYDTILGSGGMRLSEGVRQQIGIARALISDPEMLISDQATAALDPESAANIQQAMVRLMAGRTCVFIVTRLSLASNADDVILLDAGRVVASGSHEELLSNSNTYRNLFAEQYGEDQLPPISEARA